MPVIKRKRRGKLRLVIEIPDTDRVTGKRVRFRQDATMPTVGAAHEEERRLLAELHREGFLLTARQKRAKAALSTPATQKLTFREAYDEFMSTKGITRLKLTTRRGYEVSLQTYLLPRRQKIPVADVGFTQFAELDASLVKQGLKPTSRANVQCAARSVLRHCVDIGALLEMPRLPKLPKGGEAILRIPETGTIDEMLGKAKPYLRRVILLAVDAGLRAGEVRGVRWMDVDLARGTLCVRETVYFGQRDTPKSGHEREIPLTPRLKAELTEAAKTPHLPTDPLAPKSLGRVWGESSLAHAVNGLRGIATQSDRLVGAGLVTWSTDGQQPLGRAKRWRCEREESRMFVNTWRSGRVV